MNGTQTTRSIAAGSGPGVQALINEWTDTGYVVESTFDNDRWWHRRVSPRLVSAACIPAARHYVLSANDAATKEVGALFTDGYAVESTQIHGSWVNRAVTAGAR